MNNELIFKTKLNKLQFNNLIHHLSIDLPVRETCIKNIYRVWDEITHYINKSVEYSI